MTKTTWIVQGEKTNKEFYDCNEWATRAAATENLKQIASADPDRNFRLVQRVVTDTVVKRVRATAKGAA